MEIASPAYLRELPTHGRLELPDDRKDELIHHLLDHMREEYDYGHSAQSLVWPPVGRVDEWKLNTPDGQELARLWVINRKAEFYLGVASDHEPAEAEVELWDRGVTAALDRMGSRKSVDWVAIIEQKQTSAHDMSSQKLNVPAKVNSLVFGLVAGCFVAEVSVNFPHTGMAVGQFPHWPIRIAGSTACYSWDADGHTQTSMRLRRLTALLSLAWDSYWTLREGPHDPTMTGGDAEGPLMGRSFQPLPDESLLAMGGRPVTVPSWLGQAEAALRKKPRLGHALLTHHEGLAFRRDHSSMALVAFVSAIEATAQLQKKPEKCQCCDACDSYVDLRKSFDATVQSVLSEKSAALLSKAYPKRSRTAHQGRLHGTELRANSWGLMSLFTPDDEFDFTEGTVRAAQEASRKLLLRELGVEVPSA